MYDKQMELFEDGGLRDEGGMVDEESGNEVPVGSTRKEVRDDIPAMLSEGEFVFPADVVRFIGLEKLMKIRQNAKQGLKQMEAMGQMGNSDEATMPDDLPFGMMDLIIVEGEEEEPEEKAHGGVVHMQKGGFTVPKFDPRNQDVRQYENAEGKKLNIPFFDNKPLYPIPEGYFPVGTVVEEEKDETKEAIPTDDDPRDPSGAGQVTNAFTEAGSWEGSPLDMYIKEAEKVSTFGNVAAGVMAATVPVLGAFVSLANKNQKKRILATIDARIEEAKKTDVPGQVLALREVKDRLTKDERKGILGGIVGEIIDGIADGLGLSKAEKVTAKVTSNYNATVDPTESDEKTTDTQEKLLKELTAKGFKLGSPDDAVPKGTLSFGSLVPKSGEEIIEAVKTLPLTDDDMGLPTEPVPEILTEQDRFTSGEIGKSEVSSVLAPDESLRPVSKPEELKDIGSSGNTLNAEQTEALRKAGIDINRVDPDEARRALALAALPASFEVDTPLNSDETIQKLKGYKNKLEKPITAKGAIPPSTSSSLSPPTVEEQTKEILATETLTDDDMGLPTEPVPETLTDDDMGLPTKPISEYPFAPTTVTEDLRSILDDLRNFTKITDEIKATNIKQLESNEPAISKGKELYDKLTSSVSEASSSDDEGPMKFASVTKQDRVSSGPQKPKRVGTQSKDDDGPSAAERHRQSESTPKVKTRTDKDSMVAKSEQAGGAAKSYADIAKEDDPFGLLNKGGLIKKGGLASRKK